MFRIGIDFGGTNIACGVVSEDGKLIAKKSVPTREANDDAFKICGKMAELALDTIKEQNIREEDVIVIGIGVPGAVDRDKSIIIHTANVPFDNFNVGDVFAKYTKIPVKLENDANCAALGEATSGAAKGVANSLTVTLGTGVGGGIIIDGKIYSGFNFAGGELGHVVTHVGGRKCGCGRCGCFEQYASASAIINDAKTALVENPDSKIADFCGRNPDCINAKMVFDAKDAGDKTAEKVVENYIAELGEGLANFINIFQPEILLISGGVCHQGEKLLAPLREYVYARSFGSDTLSRTQILRATLGNDAGIIGAAML